MSEETKAGFRPLRRIKDWVLHWVNSPHATTAALLVSFTSAWLIPVPPDMLLIPLFLAKPEKTIRLGLIASLLYMLGWVIGYWIGFYGHLWFGEEIVRKLGIEGLMKTLHGYYDEYGAWAILAGSATPLSDKLFSFGSGILQYPFGKFVTMVVIGSTVRIMGPAILLKIYGPPIVRFADKYFEWIAFAVIVAAFLAVAILKIF